jgi:aminomethyltransferase
MPLWYSGISAEHLAVRNSCGIFDISHMGRLIVEGNGSAEFLDYLVPSNMLNLSAEKGLYTVLCNESAGILDDIIIYRLADKFLVVVNAANLERNLQWMNSKNNFGARISDITMESSMLAVQGPDAVEVLRKALGIELSGMARFGIAEHDLQIGNLLIARTGYTGEDGFEIIINSDRPEGALAVWNKIISAGSLPCGLGARDTLRLEAGLCLYGQDLNDKITPVEASLSWVVSKAKGKYIGKQIIDSQMQGKAIISKVGIEMVAQGIPRKDYQIYKGSKIGEITSGTFSPLLKKGIAMGYVASEYSSTGTEVEIDIRGRRVPAKIVKPPFYDQTLFGWKRTEKN